MKKILLFSLVLFLVYQVIGLQEAQGLPCCSGINAVYNTIHSDPWFRDQHCPKVREWNQNQNPDDPYDDWISTGKMCYMWHRVVTRTLCCFQNCGGISTEAYCIPHCDDIDKPFIMDAWGCGAGSRITKVYEEWDMVNLPPYYKGINYLRGCNACSCFCDEPAQLCICNDIARKEYQFDDCVGKPNCP